MKKLFTLLTCLVTTTLFAAPAQPTKIYKISLVVFSQFSDTGFSQEQWPPIVDRSWLNNPKQIQLTYPQPNTQIPANAPDTILPANQSDLTQAATKLARNKHYRVLLNISWLQPLKRLGKSVTVHIFGGQAYDNSGSTLSLLPSDPTALSSNAIWEINGLITLRLTRFIDTDFNLLFSLPTSVINQYTSSDNLYNVQNDFGYFQLLQKRRMRSNELNYIDFPMYGVLIKATRYTENGNNVTT